MRKILMLLLLIAFSSTALEAAPPRWNKRKIQRKNTVEKTNRRAKKIQRQNGIGLVPEVNWEEVLYV